jgi:RimJ/RimL family protein N-acetyltransferase
MNADSEVMRFFPTVLDRSESDATAQRIIAHFEAHPFGLWAVEVKDGAPFIGFIGLMVPRFEAHFTPCVEVGWRLAREHWQNGYATEGARAAVQYGFERLDLEEIVSMTIPKNRPSRRVMEKLSMTHDPDDDFDHPLVDADSPICRHVLYRLNRNPSR